MVFCEHTTFWQHVWIFAVHGHGTTHPSTCIDGVKGMADGQMMGEMNVLYSCSYLSTLFVCHIQASQLSYKKKCWVVLLDGHLLIYTRATDVKPKEVIQLKTCYFTVLEKVVRGEDKSHDCSQHSSSRPHLLA